MQPRDALTSNTGIARGVGAAKLPCPGISRPPQPPENAATTGRDLLSSPRGEYFATKTIRLLNFVAQLLRNTVCPRPLMFANRVSNFLAAPALVPVAVGFCPAFVACPAPLFASFTAAHQAFIAEVYRRAQELTEAQMRRPARRALPEFSLN